MPKTREILRQKWVLGRSYREVRDRLGVSLGVANWVVKKAEEVGLDWPQVEELPDEVLEQRIHGDNPAPDEKRPKPDCAYLHAERKRPGVTLEVLHHEYLEQHPDGYRYTQFCHHYREWLKKRRLSMRHVHRAGEKLFVDYSGKKPHIVDRHTGECFEVELFVAVLGASNFTYAEATRTQKSEDWIASHIRTLEFIGGVPAVLVPDQLKSGVTKACRYEPEVQRTYDELAEHYGTVVIPARPRKPKDKAKAEVAVQVVQRWILARLRNQVFFTLDELNRRIHELLEKLNNRTMRLYKASRRELYERLDKPALRSLPAERFVFGRWKSARVNLDYHIEIERHYYSVPFQLRAELVDTRYTATTVEIYHRGQRVASHPRNHQKGHHTTIAVHMPSAHRKHLEWSPSRLIHWAKTVGPRTGDLVTEILNSRPHPEQGYRTCLGILRLERQFGEPRLEAACTRALIAGARSYRHVQSILKNGLDRMPPPEVRSQDGPPVVHDNVRGGEYYQ